MSLKRTLVVSQGKGGSGKTTVTANLAGLVAAAGMRVLAIDLDPQGNLARDLGYEQNEGRELVAGLISSPATVPLIRNVRAGLDVVPGGKRAARLAGNFDSEQDGGDTLSAALEQALGAIAHDYDLIIIDTPPGEEMVVQAAMGVATSVLIPTKTDEASLDGLALTAERFQSAASRNRDLRLAGVVLFQVNPRAARIVNDTRAAIESMLEGVAPVFEATIRTADSAAVDARKQGLLIHELEQAGRAAKADRLADLKHTSGMTPEQRSEYLRDKRDATLYSSDASALAGDLSSLAEQVITRIAALEETTNG